MVQLNLVFSELDKTKNKLKILNNELKQKIEDQDEYEDINSKKKLLSLKLSTIKAKVKELNMEIVMEIESLKSAVKASKQQLSDKAIIDLAKGKNVEIKYNGFIYQPEFSVKYVKTKEHAEVNDLLQR